MNNVLEDLYFGNINPNENMWTQNAEYGALGKVSVRLEEELCARLNAEEKKMLEGFVAAIGNMNAMEVCLRFAQGFRLGAKIMLDVLAYQDATI